MNKLDPQKLCTAPPLEWLAIPKDDEGKAYPVTRIDLPDDMVCVVRRGSRRWLRLSECHLCASTGYTDSKGEKMWGGQLIRRFGLGVGIICWRNGGWSFYDLRTESYPLAEDWSRSDTFTNIGHIHIKPWQEEVRELLEKGENDDS